MKVPKRIEEIALKFAKENGWDSIEFKEEDKENFYFLLFIDFWKTEESQYCCTGLPPTISINKNTLSVSVEHG